MTIFIGDVHGKYRQYRRIIAKCPASIQVGDMGVGFRRTQGPNTGHIYGNPPFYAMVRGRHRFIRGNHDNPIECRRHPLWIEDGFIEKEVMYIGGAGSIDRAFRVENYSWWADEELSAQELYTLTDRYISTKPRIMVTHDCPQDIASILVSQSLAIQHLNINTGNRLDNCGTRTRQAFQSMWSAHSPDIWIFGHWHYSYDQVANGTRFICLAELEAKDIDVGLP